MVWVKTVGFRSVWGEVKPEPRLWLGETKDNGARVWAAQGAWKRLQKAEATALAA